MERLIILLLLTTTIVSAQTVYRVVPGSKENKIILTIENESKETEIKNVTVKLVDQPNTISFQKKEARLETIEKVNSGDIGFTFDVQGVLDAKREDTLRFVINTGSVSWTKEILIGYELPTEFKLEQNYPNPFNPTTVIIYQIPEKGKILLKVYDILGKEVITLVDEIQEAGYYEKIFDTNSNGGGLSSGVYIYALSANEYRSVKKMMLLK